MATQPKRLLWVDDDGAERFPYEYRRLCSAGYEITWALTGEDAVDHLRSQTYEAILLDQQFPWAVGISHVWAGVMLCSWARGKERPKNAPPVVGFDDLFNEEERLSSPLEARVLIVSSFYDETVEKARRELGHPDRDVLAKPIDLKNLLALLAERVQ